jgi:hypothetical protein
VNAERRSRAIYERTGHVGRSPGAGEGAGAGAPSRQGLESIQDLGALVERAKGAGVDAAALEQAQQGGDDPKTAVVELILALDAAYFSSPLDLFLEVRMVRASLGRHLEIFRVSFAWLMSVATAIFFANYLLGASPPARLQTLNPCPGPTSPT